jgi:BASS family bile acid:Na+ symporter
MLKDIVILLGLPLVIGMWVSHQFPAFAARAQKPMKIFSMVVFSLFVVGALAANFQHFHEVHPVCRGGGVHPQPAWRWSPATALSTLLGLPERDRRAITFEMGIQNSGLGLILIFNLFDGLGGMAIVTAWWGIWHIVAGLTLATVLEEPPRLPLAPRSGAAK